MLKSPEKTNLYIQDVDKMCKMSMRICGTEKNEPQIRSKNTETRVVIYKVL